jgi:hypothetical protein
VQQVSYAHNELLQYTGFLINQSIYIYIYINPYFHPDFAPCKQGFIYIYSRGKNKNLTAQKSNSNTRFLVISIFERKKGGGCRRGNLFN